MLPSRLERDVRVDFPFAQREGRARVAIERDLARIVEGTRAADPHVSSILLVGGFARGEGTLSRGRPVNDYDLIATRTRPRPPEGLYPALAADLERTLGLHVDLAPIWDSWLPFVPKSIFWYEAREAGKTLTGREMRPAIRAVAPENLPLDEGVRLLFNRAAGLLGAAKEEPDPFVLTLQAVKAHLACAEALLLAHGRYHWSQRTREERFRDLALPEGLAHLPRAVADATAWKLSSDARADPDPGALWDDARDDLVDVLGLILGRAGTTLARELRHDPWTSRLVWLLRAGRLRPASPRARLRAATLRLLAACDAGRPRPGADIGSARGLLAPFGATADGDFDDLRERLLVARPLTLS